MNITIRPQVLAGMIILGALAGIAMYFDHTTEAGIAITGIVAAVGKLTD